MPKKKIKEKLLTRKEAREIAARIIVGWLVVFSNIPKKLIPVNLYRAKYNIDRVEKEFRKLIDELREIVSDVYE